MLSEGTIFYGGQTNEEDLYIAPTVLLDCKPTSKLLTEEIFGPLLPIVEIPSMADAIKYVTWKSDPIASCQTLGMLDMH